MRKLILTLLLTVVPVCAANESYRALRSEAKERLYFSQRRLMEREAYYAFIEPYLQEAERTLCIFQYWKEHPSCEACGQYGTSLHLYAIALFHDSMDPCPASRGRLDMVREHILGDIERVKREAGLSSLDVQKELQKSVHLLEKTNLQYYKNLSFQAKAGIWFTNKIIFPVATKMYEWDVQMRRKSRIR